jgi:hypothetical protein
MKTLTRKIKEAFENSENVRKDSGFIYLDAEELQALVNMRKVQRFNISTPIDRYTDEQGSTYYQGIGHIFISRTQAKEGIKDFIEHNEVKGSKTFAKVYISKWVNDRYYVSL